MIAALDEGNLGGYSLAYGGDDGYFPSTLPPRSRQFPGRDMHHRRIVLLAAAAAFTYYNIPLLETYRPTVGANQYGIFLQAFG